MDNLDKYIASALVGSAVIKILEITINFFINGTLLFLILTNPSVLLFQLLMLFLIPLGLAALFNQYRLNPFWIPLLYYGIKETYNIFLIYQLFTGQISSAILTISIIFAETMLLGAFGGLITLKLFRKWKGKI